jgi:hypothetical protein
MNFFLKSTSCLLLSITNPLFIFMCILRDQQKNPKVLCQGCSPQFYVPTFPWNFILFMKQERGEEIKKKVTEGEVPVLVHSPKVWEHPWVPLL